MGDHRHQGGEHTGAAARMRRYRARRRGGVQIANVEVGSEVLWALVASGWATHAEAGDPVALGKAVAGLLDTWMRGALQTPERYAVTRKRDTRNRPA